MACFSHFETAPLMGENNMRFADAGGLILILVKMA